MILIKFKLNLETVAESFLFYIKRNRLAECSSVAKIVIQYLCTTYVDAKGLND